MSPSRYLVVAFRDGHGADGVPPCSRRGMEVIVEALVIGILMTGRFAGF